MAVKTTGRGPEKIHNKPFEVGPFVLTLVVAAICVASMAFSERTGLREGLFLVLFLLTGLFFLWEYWLSFYRKERLSFTNNDNPVRFWITVMAGIVSLFVAGSFLPVPFWPVQAVFLMLSLFGNLATGIMGGTLLMAVPCMILGLPAENGFTLFLSGMIIVLVFRVMEQKGRILLPVVASSLAETGLLLFAGVFFGSSVNLMSALAGCALNICCSAVVMYAFRRTVLNEAGDVYARLLDPEGEFLKDFREESKLEYLKGVHASYFGEKIAERMGWDMQALKCACLYYKWGNDLPDIIRKSKMPSKAARILMDYFDNEIADIPQVRMKETAALVCTDIVLGSMIYMLNKDAELPAYPVIIEAIFERMRKKGAFDRCDITGKELYMIKELFKEETYYYDTLRRK